MHINESESSESQFETTQASIVAPRQTIIKRTAVARETYPPIEQPPPSQTNWVELQRRGTRSGWPTLLCWMLSDALAVCAAVATSIWATHWAMGSEVLGAVHVAFLAASAVWIIHLMMNGYNSNFAHTAASFRRWGSAGLTATVLAAIASIVLAPERLDILVISAGSSLGMLIYSPVFRSFAQWFGKRFWWWGRRVAVCGANDVGVEIFRRLIARPQWGLRPIGFIDEPMAIDSDIPKEAYLGPPSQAPELARTHRISLAILAIPDYSEPSQKCDDKNRIQLREGVDAFPEWILARGGASGNNGGNGSPHSFDLRLPSLHAAVCDLQGQTVVHVRDDLQLPHRQRIKRALDFGAALAMAIVLTPVWLLIALLIKITSAGPALYFDERVGRGGRRFRVWKFRTMWQDADQRLEQTLQQQPALRREWELTHKLRNDPRVTCIGKFLRQTSLDELPQLGNILLGEMSFVGPRPIPPAEIEKYGEHLEAYQRVLPGVTGLWQISGRNNTTYEERVRLVGYYVLNWSLSLDVYILAATFRVVVLREGAY